MVVLQRLVTYEGCLSGAICVTVICGNIKGQDFPGSMRQQVFLLNPCGFLLESSTLAWIKPPKKTGTLYT